MSTASGTAVTVGVPREVLEGERRVAMSPAALPALVKAGARVVVESGAGAAAGFTDQAYVDKGAEIGSRADALGADVVAMVRVTPEAGLDQLRSGQVVVGMAAPFATPEVSRQVAGRGATLFALELVPRTSRAQSMDVLSSQANVAGYKAVLLAASNMPKMFPLLTTAAGTIPPAKVFVVGAGVAGLSAIATSRRLGAVVEAYDVRPAVKEEVQSLGARFVELPLETGQEGPGSGAYAQQLSEETLRKQRELLAKTVAGSDVVITTAQVQGAKAPVIVTEEMVRGMSPGSVVVDLAAEQGGNCEATVAGETVDVGGVSVIGPVNLPGTIPAHASLMYAKNVANFLGLMLKDGAVNPTVEDDIVRESRVAHGGEVVNARVREMLGLDPMPAPEPDPAPAETPEEVAG
ncbi:MAG TPA: Re/Si-specific NAD(P)(+) transhydrogenase subunit alpha [Miltoncostaeaceae bacterium]|jgi:H+-translocating NAD(P) transhydrogenase subunit alpha|nr:Re/Si-specific NAD(P)(+) transhydrogenase subunit alpha [Miltoncostaeaceae bacterium]